MDSTHSRAFIRAGFVTLATACSTRVRILFPADVVRNCSNVEGIVISSTKYLDLPVSNCAANSSLAFPHTDNSFTIFTNGSPGPMIGSLTTRETPLGDSGGEGMLAVQSASSGIDSLRSEKLKQAIWKENYTFSACKIQEKGVYSNVTNSPP